MNSVPALRRGYDWTVEDLDRLPDDGLQYELVDGLLLVTPAPVPLHQRVMGNLHLLLRETVPADCEVFLAPLDFRPTQRRSLQPDLLVVRRADVGPKNINRPLLLAVEVLSPSTRAKDRLLKRAVYEESEVAAYWIVDPDEPSLVALELRDGAYVEAGAASGDQSVVLPRPYDVTVCPADLIR